MRMSLRNTTKPSTIYQVAHSNFVTWNSGVSRGGGRPPWVTFFCGWI